ncbi:SRPBCC domain-containing protein [Leptospira semungkisensis]|uniref:SRPBCC domain-containing protein n=1 Tax=Leptospira semungkisensis TaxID=2484985 RepID=A0A4R9FYQ5_9LEPT|nr:SRPBCC domain-containing protein [Leptospira semungkisensis]TGK04011.1 SRPBCC domain-containing protein [Leptospira semungkisensis]
MVPTEILKVEKRINAEPARLFQAWLKPEAISQWFLSEADVGIESVNVDPRPGGKFKINMLLNGKILPHEGEYHIIEEPTKLVFTWRSDATGGKETLVTVTFTELMDAETENSTSAKRKPQTLVTLIHENLVGTESIEKHRFGWTSILEGLSKWGS